MQLFIDALSEVELQKIIDIDFDSLSNEYDSEYYFDRCIFINDLPFKIK